ncbi:uncharacterized protein LOC122949866 [Acropora millepora]|uniref:uncharacterized protein LOC122949866 n=1 Tax=Acropora millepora TaxID=45264 RepID=UPI001CF23E3C|nr:uncharacterized protein LOC122949866 [Acropora millepora]XP_044165851.1 uncharacterized protein LOC122949866 [Acropora millepora]XP_044165852.1 uncharacterized protein LOC122949866 [Acropora millepora]
MMLWFWLSANFLISRIIHIETTNEACHGESSVSGKFLKGHTFETITVDSPTRCQMLCSQDVRCQSYNFIISKRICELNNRTKEARPEDFVDDPWRFYMKGGFSRAPLGSIEELPGKSCAEIKASEGKAMTYGIHWIYSDENLDQAIQATCEDVWQKVNNNPVCFGARDDRYGAFHVTKTGVVKSIKLVHRNGSIKCNPDYPSTFWSCSNINYYPSNTFMTVITNAKKQALLPSVENIKAYGCNGKKDSYVLDGVNQGSPELILGNLSRPLSLLKDQQLQIWYGQDWVDCSENNNNGTSCVDIFAWYV